MTTPEQVLWVPFENEGMAATCTDQGRRAFVFSGPVGTCGHQAQLISLLVRSKTTEPGAIFKGHCCK